MVEELHHAYGTFDPVHLQIHSGLSKTHTDEPPSPGTSDEGVVSWLTMVHESMHFAQFSSTTFGLLVTLTRIRQRRELIMACRELVEQMAARGERPVFYTPFVEAIEKGLYPEYLSGVLVERFLPEWTRAENNLRSNFGVWPEGFGAPAHAAMPPGLVRHLSGSLEFVNEPFTVAHVMEPAAVALHTAWVLHNVEEERARSILLRVRSTGPEYVAFPAIEQDLGIDFDTRLMIHDIALMLPMQHMLPLLPPPAPLSREAKLRHERLASRAHRTVEPESFSPPARLLAMLEVLRDGGVPAPQGESSPAARYKLVAEIMAKELDWPDPIENVEEALHAAREGREHFRDSGLDLIFEDFVRAFEVRRTEPDAFCCGSEASAELHNAGWQPIWVHPEGFVHADSQSAEGSVQRLRVMLESRANRSLVLGDEGWECPRAQACGRSSDSKTPFFARSSENPHCECSFAVELATGGAFKVEDIVTIP